MSYAVIISTNKPDEYNWTIENNDEVIATSKHSFPNEFECLADLHLLMSAIDDFLK